MEIALLVKDGRYSTSYLPSGVYAEIRGASVCRDQIMKQHVRLSNQVQGWLQKFFPEYFECYADQDSTSGLILLKEASLPQDILKMGAGRINQIWRDEKVHGAGIKRAQTLVEAAQNSVGLEGGEAARLEIVKKNSGKKKGQPGISKRGRRKLRRIMYESARALMTWNPAFQDVFLYYRNRQKNPPGGMQAKIAVACKAIRVFYVVLQIGCDFDEEKFRKDIIRPEVA